MDGPLRERFCHGFFGALVALACVVRVLGGGRARKRVSSRLRYCLQSKYLTGTALHDARATWMLLC